VPQEAEVLVPPPSVFRIVTVAKFHGSLMVTLERVESPLTYLALPPAPPATAHVSSGGSAVTSPLAVAASRSLFELSVPDLALIVRDAVVVCPCCCMTRVAGRLQRRRL
jgi:hypothetical protein